MRRSMTRGLGALLGGWLACAAGTTWAAHAPEGAPAADLTALSLEELMSIEVTVTSAAKRPQRLGDAAAAMFVLTGDEIRRSGAATIPDALRLVPGLQVVRSGPGKWFVTSRGFNGRDANKLLVLFDGVSAYTPLFSGILWQREGVPLEDIDRIEVIRGAGATLWGANAVNGVINVITKPAAQTQGGIATATAGTEERGAVFLRQGGRLGDLGHFRVYGEGARRDAGGDPAGGRAEDDSRFGRVGFRADLDPTARDRVTIQGDALRGRSGDTTVAPLFVPPYERAVSSTVTDVNANLLGRWRRGLSDTAHLTTQAYYQHARSDSVLGLFQEDTVDLDVEHGFAASPRNEFLWGGGVRWYRSRIGGGLIQADSAARAGFLLSVFAQNQTTLIPKILTLTLGAKVEHRPDTGLAVQPTARLVWTPHPDHAVWAAVSRAVRTPSRAEQDFTGVQQVQAVPGGLPVAIRLSGNRDLLSETLIAYEAGYRVRPTRSLSLDIAGFHNVYADLRGYAAGMPLPRFDPVPHLLLPVTARNGLKGETYGVELAAEWDVRPGWRLRGAYSALRMHLTPKDAGSGALPPGVNGDSPVQQLVLRSSHDLTPDLDLDVALRAVGRTPSDGPGGYVGLDLRLAWRPQAAWELALVGQNLLGREHQEALVSTVDRTPSTVQRGVYAKLTRRF